MAILEIHIYSVTEGHGSTPAGDVANTHTSCSQPLVSRNHLAASLHNLNNLRRQQHQLATQIVCQARLGDTRPMRVVSSGRDTSNVLPIGSMLNGTCDRRQQEDVRQRGKTNFIFKSVSQLGLVVRAPSPKSSAILIVIMSGITLSTWYILKCTFYQVAMTTRPSCDDEVNPL
ncbi:unnamed protein product [Protopolystoma xenopodis]|uniref:Uncharacterized protein n=1 Tax=Protopolystoma xenopodis TaxID=117903 RepID=A0A448WDE4_9PLAT|nr:unnamed protein product [Protopolystoma xenopodis]